jgi:transposase
MANVTLLGIDIAKNVFQLHGVDSKGNVVLQQRVNRDKLVESINKMASCSIVMEACGGANHWYRKFKALNHEVKLISPQFVKPFVKTNKSDQNDAEAICEAASRPSMRYVSPKTIEQEDLQALHRVRTRLVQERTALINQIRGLLAEYGLVVPQGIHKIKKQLPEILEDAENELSHAGRQLFNDLYEEINEKNTKIKQYDIKLKTLFKTNDTCKKIAEIEGVGIMTATAIISAIGDPKVFKNGRHFAAFLGLVPKQYSSGNKQRLLGISKRGDTYVRTLLIHGGRSVVRFVGTKEDCRSKWIRNLKERRGANIAAVAVANKNARVIWALLAKSKCYEKAA